MRRGLLLAVPLLLAFGLLLPPRPAAGCAVAPHAGDRVNISGESALIVYDAATKTEHFIRTASFQSSSADFGFLVPTPGKPELAESSAEVFGELSRLTERRTEVRKRAKELTFGCGPGAAVYQKVGSAIAPGGADSAVREPAVRVVEQKRVGDLLATVLQATDPKELRDWLTTNGYAAPPNLEDWFKPYTAGGWYLSAFKIAADAPKGIGMIGLTNAAVRISFPAERPFYPYREPADMQADKTPRWLRLFVLSDSRVSGSIGNNGAWPGQTEWSNAVAAERLASAVAKGKLPASVSGREWHLTEFLDSSSPRPGTDELYFDKAADQGNVERPPNIVWEEYDPWPWLFGTIAVLALAALGLVVWKVVRKG